MPYAASRALLLAVTAIGVMIRGLPAIDLWNQWDARWYTGIAASGYHFSLHGKPALAFFPLFPLLLHPFIAAGVPGVLAGMVLSNLAFLGALFYLHALARESVGPQLASRAMWLISLFPMAVFTFAPYTESLFLLCASGALYHARRQDVAITGLWLAVGLLTRSTMLVVVLPALLYLRPLSLLERLLSLIPAILAWCGYLIYLTGEHFTVHGLVTAESSWNRTLSFPWAGFVASISWLVRNGPGNIPWSIENIMQLTVTLVFIVFSISARGQLDLPWRLYFLGFWALSLLSPEWQHDYYAPFSSMNRFVVALFPLAWWAASTGLVSRRFTYVSCVLAILLCVSASVQTSGGWVG